MYCLRKEFQNGRANSLTKDLRWIRDVTKEHVQQSEQKIACSALQNRFTRCHKFWSVDPEQARVKEFHTQRFKMQWYLGDSCTCFSWWSVDVVLSCRVSWFESAHNRLSGAKSAVRVSVSQLLRLPRLELLAWQPDRTKQNQTSYQNRSSKDLTLCNPNSGQIPAHLGAEGHCSQSMRLSWKSINVTATKKKQ